MSRFASISMALRVRSRRSADALVREFMPVLGCSRSRTRGRRRPRAFLNAPWMALWVGVLGIAAGPGNAMAQRPLGTDVSGYQPSINWTTVKNGGVAFAWAKATEGTGYTNPSFTSQEAGAKSVGIYIGAYHFARPSSHPNITGASSADSEAAYFWSVAGNYVKLGGGYLVPMLDWEDTGATTNNGFTATMMSAWVNEWCNAVSNSARLNGVPGVRPVVYTGTWYSVPGSTYPGLTTAVTSWPSWIAAYPTSPNPQTGGPSSSYPWSTWNIWPYADTNWSGGDADVFNGDATGLNSYVIPNAPASPSPANNATNVSTTPTLDWAELPYELRRSRKLVLFAR